MRVAAVTDRLACWSRSWLQLVRLKTAHSAELSRVRARSVERASSVDHQPLAVDNHPVPEQPSMVSILDRESHSRKIFEGVPDLFEVARYHSLHGPKAKLPEVLRPTAMTSDGVVSASCCHSTSGSSPSWAGRFGPRS